MPIESENVYQEAPLQQLVLIHSLQCALNMWVKVHKSVCPCRSSQKTNKNSPAAWSEMISVLIIPPLYSHVYKKLVLFAQAQS